MSRRQAILKISGISLLLGSLLWSFVEIYWPGGTGIGATVKVDNPTWFKESKPGGAILSHASIDDEISDFRPPCKSISELRSDPLWIFLTNGSRLKIMAVCVSDEGEEYRGVRVIEGAYEGYTGSLPLDVIVPTRREGWITQAINPKRSQLREAKRKRQDERLEIARREAEIQAQLEAERIADQTKLAAEQARKRLSEDAKLKAQAFAAERARSEAEREQLRREELQRQRDDAIAKAERERVEAEALRAKIADQETKVRAEASMKSRVEPYMKIRGEPQISGEVETLGNRIMRVEKAGVHAEIEIRDVLGRAIVPGVLGDSVSAWRRFSEAIKTLEKGTFHRLYKELSDLNQELAQLYWGTKRSTISTPLSRSFQMEQTSMK